MSENLRKRAFVLAIIGMVMLSMIATPVPAASGSDDATESDDTTKSASTSENDADTQFPGREWAPGEEDVPDSVFDEHFPHTKFDGKDTVPAIVVFDDDDDDLEDDPHIKG